MRISEALNAIDTRTQSLQDKHVTLTAEIEEVKTNITTTLGSCSGSGATSGCSDLQTAVSALTVQADYNQVAGHLTSHQPSLIIVHSS